MACLCSMFTACIAFYQLWAFHWLSPKPSWVGRCETVLYITLNCSLATGLFYWIYKHQTHFLFSGNILGYLVDFSKFVLIVLVYYTIMLENWWHRKALQQMWTELNWLHVRCIPSPRWATLQRRHFTIVGCFLAHLAWWEFTYAYGVTSTARGKNFTVTFWLLFMLLHLRQLQILLYTDLVGFCLTELNGRLRWTVELSQGASRYGGPRSDGQICGNLSSLMDGFTRVHRLLELLYRTFGYSFVVIRFITHFYLLTDTYWIVYGFLKSQIFQSLYLECCLLSKIICLMLNLRSNEQIWQECARMRELLHSVDLSWQLRCELGYQMVHNFLFKMDACRLTDFRVLSLFRMGYGVMMEIVLNVSASISLFIQATG